VARLLLGSGTDVDVTDSYGWAMMHQTIRGVSADEMVVRLLLDIGTKMEGKDSAGRTALMSAAECFFEARIQLSVNVGANDDTRSNDRWTVLHWTIMRGTMVYYVCLSTRERI
jgi:ankyrin repeat protein